MVNLSGISFDHRMTEDTGAGVVDVTRAWVAARDIFDFPAMWDEIEALPPHVKLDTQLELFLDCRRMAERARCGCCATAGRRSTSRPRSPSSEPGISELSTTLEPHLRRPDARPVVRATRRRGWPPACPSSSPQRSAVWPLLHTGVRRRSSSPTASDLAVREAAAAYWEMFDAARLVWLWDAIGALPRSDRWQTQARSALRDDLLSGLAELADDALVRRRRAVDVGRQPTSGSVARAMAMFTEIRRADAYDLTTLSVALRQLRNLALITQRPTVPV